MSERKEQYEKQISRMVKDTDGISVLKDMLGVRVQKVDKSFPTVAILMPSSDGRPRAHCWKALEAAIIHARLDIWLYKCILYINSNYLPIEDSCKVQNNT